MIKAEQIPSKVRQAAWKAMRGSYKPADDLMDATIAAAPQCVAGDVAHRCG
jgi:hypothetical protein